MSIFQTDETAWSALTKSMETIIKSNDSRIVVQTPTVFRPLPISGKIDRHLAMFYKLLVTDKIPTYGNKDTNGYIGTGASVQTAYGQYIQALNVALTDRFAPPQDQAKIGDLRRSYDKAAKASAKFERDAEADWKRQKRLHPGLSRVVWDQGYGDMGYTPKKKELLDDVYESYGYWQAAAHPYPELSRVVSNKYDYDNNPAYKISLPETTDDLNDPPEAWETFLKSNLNLPADFFTHDATEILEINEASSISTQYESRWEAGGSVSYSFFSVGGSAGGGSIENHLRQGTQKLSFTFDRLIPVEVLRQKWFDEGLFNAPYNSYVDSKEYWEKGGQLPLIPIMALIGRGLKVSVQTSSTAYDEFDTWYHSSGSAGFSFGPWSVGASANSSTSSSSVSNTSTGTSISFTDNSDTPYVISVVSRKMDDWVHNRQKALLDGKETMDELIQQAIDFENKNPGVVG